mgnify:CR=1 FL=1
MAIFQDFLAAIWPPYAHRLNAERTKKFLVAIAHGLPESLAEIKDQLLEISYTSFDEKINKDGFRMLSCGYSPALMKRFRRLGVHHRISGIRIFCTRTQRWEDLEIKTHENCPLNWRCSFPEFTVTDFDLNQINTTDLLVETLDLPPSALELFLETLGPDIRSLIKVEDLEEYELNNRTFYGFLDLGEGNSIAFDKKGTVYSLVHDAKPMVKKMKISLPEILKAISEGHFNQESHLDDRYRGK